MTLKNILNQPEGGFSPVIDAYKALKFLSFVGFWIFFALWWGFVVVWALYGSLKLYSIWRAPD